MVSNRLDLPPGNTAPGGLAVSLAATLRHTDSLWFGWSGNVEPANAEPRRESRNGIEYAIVGLSADEHRNHYHGFCNRVLWPLSHGQPVDAAAASSDWYRSYLQVNARMATQLLPLLRPGDSVWVHDYHLLPLGHFLREAGCANPLGHFLHVPFPGLDDCPHGGELLDFLPAFDLLGFQTPRDLAAFEASACRRWGTAAIAGGGVRDHRGRHCATGVFPVGVEVDAIYRAASMMATTTEARWWSTGAGPRLIGADRLDASKGLSERLQGFRRLLADWPARRPLPDYLQLVTPSRLELAAQRNLQDRLREESRQFAEGMRAAERNPLRCVFAAVAHAELMGLLRSADVGLVTPLRDGMNLLAKEFVAAQPEEDPGVLVLSRGAGAALELAAALQVEPEDPHSVASALRQAIRMPLDERCERHRAMLDSLRGNELPRWRRRFVEQLRAAHRDRRAG